MKFTVVWLPRAEQELAEVWDRSTDRAAVTRSADRTDRLLSSFPDRLGEERPDKRRLLFDGPLGILFRVLMDDRLVRVISVWDVTRR